MHQMLQGQEGQCDIIFIGYELYKEGFYHKDKERSSIHWRRMAIYLLAIAIVFLTQIYFIHHIVIENAANIRTMTNVDNVEGSSLDVYKMYIYSKDHEKLPSILQSYKEEHDSDFEKKFTDKTCDARAAS